MKHRHRSRGHALRRRYGHAGPDWEKLRDDPSFWTDIGPYWVLVVRWERGRRYAPPTQSRQFVGPFAVLGEAEKYAAKLRKSKTTASADIVSQVEKEREEEKRRREYEIREASRR